VAESFYTQVLAAVKARLAGIVGNGGATYWYTPHAVIQHPALTEACLRADLGTSLVTDPATIYVLSPGLEEAAPATMGTSGRERAEFSLDLTLAQLFPPATAEDPYNPPNPDRITVQSRLARDATKALLKDFADGVTSVFGLTDATLGSVVTNVTVEAVDRTAANTWEDGWALVFLRVRILYHYTVATP
jgi:hypothetical protein